MTTILILTAFGGAPCNVVVANRGYAYTPTYAPTYAYTPYYTASTLAYKVEDPERAALVRQNEKLTDALIHEVRANRERADRLEQSIGQGGADVPQSVGAPKAAAAAILSRNCLGCHSGDKAKGGVVLAGSPSLATRLLVNEVVSKGEMPPKDRRPLTADEKKTVAEWAVVTREELKQATHASASK